MELQALEREAQSAIAAASTVAELDDVRVHYLGRKSELKQALRGVRDRESGMALNEVRERLEAAVEDRRQELEQAELDRTLEEEYVDVTFPGDAPPRGRLHLLTQIRRDVAQALFGEDRRARFRTSFFPFTEPSVETDVSCFLCEGEGCAVCKQSGWIELGGSGMVDPNVLRTVGYDPEEVSGFAFGWGLERMAMLRHGLTDIRDLWQNDLRLLAQF